MGRIKQINFKILDGIRGISALYVVINHCRGNMLIGGNDLDKIIPFADWELWTKLYYALLQFTILGREFVVLFFVLSGFSIAHSLKSNSSLVKFYFRRFIRLYFPFILALLYAFFVFEGTHELLNLQGKSVFHNLKYIFRNLVYIPSGQMIPQFWSLSHEVIFYIIAPFIMFHKKWYFWVSFVLFGVSLIYNPLNLTGSNIITKFLLDYNFYFALGIFLYNNLDQISNFKVFKSKKTFFVLSFLMLLISVMIKYKLGEFNKITSIIAALYSVIIIVFFLKFEIENKILQFLGEISYSLYITHFASIYFISYILIDLGQIQSQITDQPFVWILGVLFSILVSIPFYFFGEKPTKMYLKKLRKLN